MGIKFYSNGKLLITSEYGVLDGALALAIPTKYGQSLKITPWEGQTLQWKSLDENGKIWFRASYDHDTFNIHSCSDQGLAETLAHILTTAKQLNPNFIDQTQCTRVTSKLSFPRNWGLGSSSTLINNLAQWANVDPYELLKHTFGGSGYDIACAQHDSPILYQLKDDHTMVQEVVFDPPFGNQLYFVFMNQKQNSREAIANYRKRYFDTELLVDNLSNLTKEILTVNDIDQFESLLEDHEKVLSNVLNSTPVKKKVFPDYFGAIKSLGAWGGDFILATGNEKTPGYFKAKGFDNIVPFRGMLLRHP